jgi:N-methylhydantoinase B
VKTDPIKLQIFKSLLQEAADEMGATLRRSAFSPNIKERCDFSCAVFDGKAELIAQAAHIPVHLGSMPRSVKNAVRYHPFEEGDIVILNDPFHGGTHLPDITFIEGVFLDKKQPSFYVANRAHHADVGGIAPGSMSLSERIHQEGLIIPPVLLRDRGRFNNDVLDLILANVRTPVERKGDIMAQLSANRRGVRRLKDMVERFGHKELAHYGRELMDYSERLMRTVISRIPDGRYSFEDCLDDDGFGSGPLQISLSLRVSGNSAVLDFEGTAAQASGPVNCPEAVTISAVFYCFLAMAACFDDITGLPANAGALRPIAINAPLGSLVNAVYPAAVSGGNVETSQRIVDVVLGALAQALPEKIPAASSGTMSNLSIGGIDMATGRDFTYYETIAGGAGASSTTAGESAVHTHMTNTLNTPIEAIEQSYPLRVRSYKIRRSSGGKGRRRGGDGLVREIELLTDCHVSILSERRAKAPYGLAGGDAGRPGRNSLIKQNGRKEKLPGKASFNAPAGSIIRIETPGGGGYHSHTSVNQKADGS